MIHRLLIAFALALTAAAAYASTITVLVQQTDLRMRAQSYTPPIGTAKLGQRIVSAGVEAGFHKTPAGYIHSSAVTERKVKLGSAGSVGGSASAEEVTLAGKGFNAQVEKSYGQKNGSVNFAAVNAMERRSVSEADLFAFLRAGGLMGEGGSK